MKIWISSASRKRLTGRVPAYSCAEEEPCPVTGAYHSPAPPNSLLPHTWPATQFLMSHLMGTGQSEGNGPQTEVGLGRSLGLYNG